VKRYGFKKKIQTLALHKQLFTNLKLKTHFFSIKKSKGSISSITTLNRFLKCLPPFFLLCTNTALFAARLQGVPKGERSESQK